MDVWLFQYDGEVDLGNATTDEVAQVAWMDRKQIKELFDADMFVDTLEYFFTEVDKKEMLKRSQLLWSKLSWVIKVCEGDYVTDELYENINIVKTIN